MNNWLKYWCSLTFSGRRGVKVRLMTVVTDCELFLCPLPNGLFTEHTECFPVFESFKIQHIAIFRLGFVVQRILWLICTANCTAHFICHLWWSWSIILNRSVVWWTIDWNIGTHHHFLEEGGVEAWPVRVATNREVFWCTLSNGLVTMW